jgi:translation initiation factor IF-1
MSKENIIELTGEVQENLPGSKFKIKLESNGAEIIGHLSGKMRLNKIRILPGDKVKIEMSPYDLTKGRVSYRFK